MCVGEAEGLGVAAGDPPEGLERVELLAARARGPCSPRRGCGASSSWCRRRHRWRWRGGRPARGGRPCRRGRSRGRGWRSGRRPRSSRWRPSRRSRARRGGWRGRRGSRAEEAVGLVDVEVVAGLRVEREGVVDLVAVLGEVGLDVQVGVLGDEGLGHRHLLGRRGDREAGGDGVVARGPCRASGRSGSWCRRRRTGGCRGRRRGSCGPSSPCRRACGGCGLARRRSRRRPRSGARSSRRRRWWCRGRGAGRGRRRRCARRGRGRRISTRPGRCRCSASRAAGRPRSR